MRFGQSHFGLDPPTMLDIRRQTESSTMKRLITRGLWTAALAAGLFVPAAVAAQENGSPLSAIGRLFGQQPPAAAPQTTGQDATPTTDQVLRIERLEAQIRQMTGTIEQLQYRNQQLENQLRSGPPARLPRRRPQSQVMPPQPARPPAAGRTRAVHRSRPLHRRRRRSPDAAPTCSIRRRIPMHQARRARSAVRSMSRRPSSPPSRRSARRVAVAPVRRSISPTFRR